MTPTEWTQVVELFHAALETSGDQRMVLLDQACGTQRFLRKAVEELLKEYESAGSFLSEPYLTPSHAHLVPMLSRPISVLSASSCWKCWAAAAWVKCGLLAIRSWTGLWH